MPVTYDPIATQTLGSAVSQVNFNSLPTGYTDLRLICEVLGNDTGNLYLRFNGVTNVTCNSFGVRGSQTTNSRLDFRGQNYIPLNQFSQLNSSFKCTVTIDINNYNNTNTGKGSLIRGAWWNGSEQLVWYIGGLWMSSNAITSINISNSSGTLNIGSNFSLYGIAKA